MLEHIVVAVIVVAAALYATWVLLPARAQLALLRRAEASLAARAPRLTGRMLRPMLARRLRPAGCAGCGPEPHR